MRYSPAGIPILEFQITHESQQHEAGGQRRVNCEIACVALAATALLLKDVPLGSEMRVSGFLASRSLKRKTPILHVTQVEFIENFQKEE